MVFRVFLSYLRMCGYTFQIVAVLAHTGEILRVSPLDSWGILGTGLKVKSYKVCGSRLVVYLVQTTFFIWCQSLLTCPGPDSLILSRAILPAPPRALAFRARSTSFCPGPCQYYLTEGVPGPKLKHLTNSVKIFNKFHGSCVWIHPTAATTSGRVVGRELGPKEL